MLGIWLYSGYYCTKGQFMAQFISFDHIFLVFGYIFQFMGLGQFLSFDSDLQMSHELCQTVNWPQLPGVWSLPEWEAVWSSLVCMPWVCLLCQHVCQHASMPEVCQHSRGSSLKCLSFPEVPGGPRCPEGQDIVPLYQMAQNPQDCSYGIIFTWNDDNCLFYLSCDGLLAVGTVKESFIV